MLITSSQPVVQEVFSDRKSLKNHQEIRRKLTTKRLIVLLFLVVMMIIMIVFPERKQTVLDSIQKQDIVEMHQSVKEVSLGLATNYFKTYCNEDTDDCKRHDEELLMSLIELISNEKEKRLAIGLQKENSSHLPVSIQIKPTSHQKTNKPEQLEWESYFNQFEKQTLQSVALSIVKHPKLTTPRPKEQGIFNLMWSVFGLNDQYAGIDHIVQIGNKDRSIWSIEGHFATLTVKSNHFISPAVLEFNSAAEQQEKVTMLGLHIGLQRQIKAVKLSEFSLKYGFNRFYCNSQDCQQRYAMVMFLFSKMKLRHLALYQLQRF